MNKLHKAPFQGETGWQWEDGPIFIGEDARKWAVDYGQTKRRLHELTELAKLTQGRIDCENRIEHLETIMVQEEIINAVGEPLKFEFHWIDGKVEVGLGKTVDEAFAQLGYGRCAVAALSHWEEIE